MLSSQTEIILAELLSAAAKGEHAVEVSRQAFADLFDCNPHTLYRKLDRYGLSQVSFLDLKAWLNNSRLVCTEQDARLVVKQYDANADGKLSKQEFCKLVLPSLAPDLAELALSRTDYTVSTRVVDAFNALCMKEITLQRNLERIKGELVRQPDFNAVDAFKTVDRFGNDSIDRDSLILLMRRNCFPVSAPDLNAIFRRFDCDGDERLSYVEFVDAIMPAKLDKLVESRPRSRNSSRSPSRTGSPRHVRTTSYGSKALTLTPRASTPSGQKTPSRRPTSHHKARGLYRDLIPAEQEFLLQAFKDQIMILRELETAKNELATRHDFNVLDTFLMFDLEDKGFVTVTELEETLHSIGVPLIADEGFLLMKRFDENNDLKLEFRDVDAMLTPKDPDYARLLYSRHPIKAPDHQRRRIFSRETHQRLLTLMKLHLETERMTESHRQEFEGIVQADTAFTFKTLDRLADGFITKDELEAALADFGFYVTWRDMECLFERYDRNKDGRVSYAEFVQELTPQSPKRYA
jgi:Ca2+-binding EF-hand superfamily protein